MTHCSLGRSFSHFIGASFIVATSPRTLSGIQACITGSCTAVTLLVAGALHRQPGCQLVAIHRSAFRYVAHPADDGPLLAKVRELAERHPHYGERRICALVRWEARAKVCSPRSLRSAGVP